MATQKSSSDIRLSVTLIVISLIATLLGVSKEIIPQNKVPSWLIFISAAVTGAGGLLKFYQDYKGLEFSKKTGNLSEGISESVDAPKKPLTSEEERLYVNLKEEANRFRSAQITLFFSPSLNSESLYKLGLLAFNQRDFAESEKNLKYALRLDENNVKAFNLLLQIYQSTAMSRLDRQDFQQAETYLREAERLISESPIEGDLQTITLVGYCYKSLGQVYEKTDLTLSEQYWRRAGEIFDMVLIRDPENVNALNGLGNVLDHSGDSAAALEKHQAALKLVPYYAAAANDAALVCETLMQKEPGKVSTWRQKAIDYWELALELSENDPQFDQSYRDSVRRRIQYLRTRQ